MDISEDKLKLHAALFGERPGFSLPIGREIDGEHVEALFGEPDAVAAFAIGDRESPALGGEQMALGAQKGVGALAEDIFRRRIAPLPPVIFAHGDLLLN